MARNVEISTSKGEVSYSEGVDKNFFCGSTLPTIG